LQVGSRDFVRAIDRASLLASSVVLPEIDKPGPLISQMRAIEPLHDAPPVHDDLVVRRRFATQVDRMACEFEYFRVIFGEYLLCCLR